MDTIAGGLLLGTFTPKLDEKGRLILPAKFRSRMASGLVVTRGQDRCLYLMPIDEFQRIYEQARQVPVTSKQARDFLRGFLSGANDEVPDKQGRITIPSVLRAYAGLKREITAIGVGTRVELWDAAAWETYMEQQESAYSDLSEQIFPDMAF